LTEIIPFACTEHARGLGRKKEVDNEKTFKKRAYPIRKHNGRGSLELHNFTLTVPSITITLSDKTVILESSSKTTTKILNQRTKVIIPYSTIPVKIKNRTKKLTNLFLDRGGRLPYDSRKPVRPGYRIELEYREEPLKIREVSMPSARTAGSAEWDVLRNSEGLFLSSIRMERHLGRFAGDSIHPPIERVIHAATQRRP
jgi:hypothetical protein